MPQIFHRSTNTFARIAIFGAVFILAFVTWVFAELNESTYNTGATQPREQPVPFSHAHHVGRLGMDCRYCHTTVETSGFANIPPTKTCMNCHSQIWNTSPTLEPVRASFRTGTSIRWTRVNDLPDFVYFNHSIHVNKGIGCESCHGRVDQMPLDLAGELAADGVVPGLPPPTREVRAAARVHHHHGLPARGRPGKMGRRLGEGIQDPGRAYADQLLHLPPMSDKSRTHSDLAATRARLEAAGRGRDYWRSLDDLAATPEFQDLLEREFPRQAIGWSEDEDPVEGRRNFLKLMGASLALAGLTACTRQPTEHIMPYVRQPEDLIPGRPLFYATATHAERGGQRRAGGEPRRAAHQDRRQPRASGHAGRVRRFFAGSVLGLYDPDRAQAVTFEGEIRSWGDFFGALREALAAQKAKNGAGMRILTETVTSPTMADQIRRHPEALSRHPKWHQWEPAGPHSARAGARLAFGQPVNTYYDLANANVIVSLDADFLALGRGQPALRAAVRGAAPGARRPDRHEPAVRGGADAHAHRHQGRPPPAAARRRYRSVRRGAGHGPGHGQGARKTGENDDIYKWIGPIARDLQRNKGASLVIAGEYQPPAVHALAHAMNAALGNVGKTVFYTDPIEANPVDQLASLQDLVKDLDAGAVDLLLIVGGNPVFNAPVEMGMRDRIRKAALRVHLSLYDDETSELCQWRLPETHYLETLGRCARLRWHGDHPAAADPAAVRGPLGLPDSADADRSARAERLRDRQRLLGRPAHRARISKPGGGARCTMAWCPTRRCPPRRRRFTPTPSASARRKRHLGGKLEVIFRPDPTIYDGRFANNGWLQELPKPITKLTWDNAAILSPPTATGWAFTTRG